jgi:hypothetical protein
MCISGETQMLCRTLFPDYVVVCEISLSLDHLYALNISV